MALGREAGRRQSIARAVGGQSIGSEAPLTHNTHLLIMAARSSTWGEDEVKVLIAIWGDEKVQKELDGPKRKPMLHEKIAKNLQEHGYNRDAEQCTIK